MKIVLAASIYPPEVGGPATYASELAAALERLGHDVRVEVFSALARYPSGIRHALYAWRLWRASRTAQLVIAFDVLTTGLPAALVHRMTRVPTVARIGGDFIWEAFVERTGEMVPLSEFYKNRAHWSARDQRLLRLAAFVTRSVEIVFSSEWQRIIWQEPYALDTSRVRVIENAIPPREKGESPTKHDFLHYGRQLKLKNSELLRRAFAHIQPQHAGATLEEGMVPRAELFERMKRCYAVVLPSISDVTPNYILDAIRFGKPFMLTKESGYAVPFAQLGVIVDPTCERSVAEGLEQLLDADVYTRLSENIATFTRVRTYDDIARDFLALAV